MARGVKRNNAGLSTGSGDASLGDVRAVAAGHGEAAIATLYDIMSDAGQTATAQLAMDGVAARINATPLASWFFSDAKTGAIGVNIVSGVYVDAGGLPRDPVGARIVPGAYMDVAGQLRDPLPIFYIEAPVLNALLGPLDFAPLRAPTDNAPLIYELPPVTSGWNDLSIWDDTQLWSDDA
ncbi:hypothetical protein [Asticcacaulis sp. 201]|uniref:hypothetical protein n=1 Tax=Asticcacaulis sp. 201 TaxID=3028787 RepID=UPI002917020D|nr:hypothetical protein [Asticcacaulis sp. 201]MDV6329891.1 hypothetical protein [Asticcacaulis sp. 201]